MPPRRHKTDAKGHKLSKPRDAKVADASLAVILTRSLAATRGVLQLGNFCFPCAIGKGGIRAIKREGDGASPRGTWQVRRLFYRADRIQRPITGLPSRPIRPNDAWCDVIGDRNYNRLVRLPYAVLDERLWRDDHLYDLVAMLGYNDTPRVQGLGSAIFMHLARPGLLPTAGCVALDKPHLLRLLEAAGDKLSIRFGRS